MGRERPIFECVTNKKLRDRLIRQQHNRCYYCAGRMMKTDINGRQMPGMATLEHLYETYADAGMLATNEENCVAACGACNSVRDTMCPDVFYAIRRSLMHIWPPCQACPREVSRLFRRLRLRRRAAMAPKPPIRFLPAPAGLARCHTAGQS